MKIIVAGGSGFIGKQVIHELIQQKNQCVLLTRSPEKFKPRWGHIIDLVAWDGKQTGKWIKCLDGADAVINLSGESIAEGRWSEARKNRLTESRVESTRVIAEAIQAASAKPKVWINGSAIGYYGHVEEGDVTESSPRGSGFLAGLCERWEHPVLSPGISGVRTITLRTGVALGAGGGALQKMIPPFQFFIGGPIGSGSQWFSWIHVEDIAGLIVHCLNEPKIQGPVNATAPQPLRMKAFCSALGKALHRPSWAPVPAGVLKVLLGQMAEEMLLSGQKVLPAKALDTGYTFRFPEISAALTAILST